MVCALKMLHEWETVDWTDCVSVLPCSATIPEKLAQSVVQNAIALDGPGSIG
jgi:hypothetical protein